MTRSGSKARTAGSTISTNAVRYSTSPEPAASGTLTTPSAFEPGPPVPGQNGHWWSETVSTLGSSRKSASVPFPWCTSKSTTATRADSERALRVASRDRDVPEDAEAHRRALEARGGRVVERARNRPPRLRRSRSRQRVAQPRTSSHSRTCPGRARRPPRSRRWSRRTGRVHELGSRRSRPARPRRSPGTARGGTRGGPGALGSRESRARAGWRKPDG